MLSEDIETDDRLSTIEVYGRQTIEVKNTIIRNNLVEQGLVYFHLIIQFYDENSKSVLI